MLKGGHMSHQEYVSIGDLEVQITPNPGRPLLILTRMASRGMGVWDTIWDALAERFSVANFDLRMPSLEALDDPAQVFRGYATQCREVAEHLDYDGFHVLGWNGGSHVALQCAVDYGDAVHSCTMVGAFCRLPDMRRIEAGIEFMRIMFENADRKLYALYWLLAGLTPGYVDTNFDQVETWAEARARGDQFVSQNSKRVMKWVRALRNNWVSEEAMATIQTPTLIVAPDLDPWNAGPTVEMACKINLALPKSRLEVMGNAGSLIPLENPQRFLSVLEPFFMEVAP